MTHRPRITVLSLSQSDESLSRRLVGPLVDSLREAGAAVDNFDARTLPPLWVSDRKLDGAPARYHELRTLLTQSQGILLVHPVYAYASSSATKLVLELYGDVLAGRAIGFVSAAGTPRSHLATGSSIVSATFDAGAFCYPQSLQATGDDTPLGELAPKLLERVSAFGAGFERFTRAIAAMQQDDGDGTFPNAHTVLLAGSRA